MRNRSEIVNMSTLGIPMRNLTKGCVSGNPRMVAQSELEEALARMTDPNVRAHFERLLSELGHRH